MPALWARVYSLEIYTFCEAVHEAVRSTVATLGRLDILVNNAGLMLLGPVEGADTTDWTRMINVNVLGLMYLTHAALPHLPDSKGTVVQISSIAHGWSARAARSRTRASSR